MNQKTLSRWLRIIIVGCALCGIVIFGMVVPAMGLSMKLMNPEFAYCFWPWLVFIWLTAIPCYAALVLGWKITGNIRTDRSFSRENARYLSWIAVLAAIDAIRYYGGNVTGISSIFSTEKECIGYPVYSVFDPNDLDGYDVWRPHECPFCKQGIKLDALVNSHGYSKL